ncbi:MULTISPECIES: pheA operon leader peptide PheL [Enterobacteriaceae]|nr:MULTISPECIES: pheA operon leader peptide PheL [Enterobacteriaceae]
MKQTLFFFAFFFTFP